MVYLCGTKFDLVEENKKMRKVDFATVKDYADGKRNIGFVVRKTTGYSQSNRKHLYDADAFHCGALV